jgi:hypothetical protein
VTERPACSSPQVEAHFTVTARDAFGNVNAEGRDLFRVAFVEGAAAGQLSLTPQLLADGLTTTGKYRVVRHPVQRIVTVGLSGG